MSCLVGRADSKEHAVSSFAVPGHAAPSAGVCSARGTAPQLLGSLCPIQVPREEHSNGDLRLRRWRGGFHQGLSIRAFNQGGG